MMTISKNRSKGTKILSAYKKADGILIDKHYDFIKKNYEDLEKNKKMEKKYSKYVELCKNISNEVFNDGELYTILNSNANGIHEFQVGILLYQLIRQRLKTDWIKTRHFWIPKPKIFFELFWDVRNKVEEKINETSQIIES